MATERIDPSEDAFLADLASHVQRYRFAALHAKGKRVLDAGCGVGYGAQLLGKEGAAEVVAVDISADALQIASSRFLHPAVRYVRDDLEMLEKVEGPFDIVVALESFEHLRNPEKFLLRAAALLQSQGQLICTTPRRAESETGAPANPFHWKEYTLPEFQTVLEKHFQDVQMLGQHWTAGLQMAQLLWSNPFVRLGRYLQRLRGRKVPALFEVPLVPTEADLVISPLAPAHAWTLVAVCSLPR